MAIFQFSPDYSSSVSKKPRIKKMQFGDGYEQRLSDGINTNPEEWSLTFKRSPSQITAIDNFLSQREGLYPFKWTTPKGVELVFACEDWNIVEDDSGWKTLTAKFVQKFEPVPAESSYYDGSWTYDGTRLFNGIY